jgi:hypothetical protein
MRTKGRGRPESAAFRYEKKFIIEGMGIAQVMAVLKAHPAVFRELYPMRYVNNIYLDSPLLADYFSNVNGYHLRQKVRVRWYHTLFQKVDNAILEFKKKEGEVGIKEQYPFPTFRFDRSLSERGFRRLIWQSDLPQTVKFQLRDLELALCNRYKRWYFATPYKEFRVTVDGDLNYYHLGKLSNAYHHHHIQRNTIILELKYQVDDDPQANRIISALPFRITRSSKYITGIENVYL